MNRKIGVSVLAAGALAVSIVGSSAATASPTSPPVSNTVRVCQDATAHDATCFAMAVANADGSIVTSTSPFDTAFSPTDIQAAYNLKGLKSGGRTVAVVDAFGYPTLASDLAAYRSNYGLPPCTIKNGCLTITDEHGRLHHTPDTNPQWDVEQALDVDAVSAACPDCKILVIQAHNASLRHLGSGVAQAASVKGVVAISNSYGGHDRKAQDFYDHPGIAVTASTGDSGYQGGGYPADDPHVVAIAGTSVHRTGDGTDASGYTETAWSGAGSGCAKNNKAPAWQSSAHTTCKTKATGDVSAAADPNFGGLNIYYNGHFEQVGGTSESSPIIASVYALSGHTEGYPAKIAYDDPSHLNDITSGSNGSCGVPLCTARKGWDGPTGLGTPNGVKSF